MYAGAYVCTYLREAFPVRIMDEESLIASISRPESTVSKLFVLRGSSETYGKEGCLNSVSGSV